MQLDHFHKASKQESERHSCPRARPPTPPTSRAMPTPPTRPQSRRVHIIQPPRALSDPDSWAALVDKWREFRLHSLRTAPDAFSSTYAREVAFERGVWEERLRNPEAHMFVAVPMEEHVGELGEQEDQSGSFDGWENDDGAALLLGAPWAGVIVVMGPRAESFGPVTKSPWETVRSDNEAKPASGSDQSEGSTRELFCHMNAVFVDSEFRGQGIAQMLIEHAHSHVEALCKADGAASLYCTILVDKDNVAAANLYLKCGFKKVAEETMTSPRKERLDGTEVPEHEIQVLKMARRTSC